MSKLLTYTLITFLVLTVVGILGVLILGELPDSPIIVNPYSENVIYFCAYCFMALCVPGLFSIFIKRLRIPVGVAVSVLLLFFFEFCCWNAILENISYRVARGSESAERVMVIDDKDVSSNSLTLRFLEGDNAGTVSVDVPEALFYRLHEGDTCVAVVWDGLCNVRFISKIKNVRRIKK